MASGESFDDMIHRVQTRRVSNGQRGSRPGDSAMFQKASAPTAPAGDFAGREGVAPAAKLGGGKKASFGKKSFGKGGSKGGFSKGGGVQNFSRGGR